MLLVRVSDVFTESRLLYPKGKTLTKENCIFIPIPSTQLPCADEESASFNLDDYEKVI